MSSNSSREEAIADLIAALHRQHPVGFLVHPSLEFVQNGNLGIDVRSTTDLKQEEIIITVPESTRFSVGNIPTAADCDHPLNGAAAAPVAVQLRSLIDAIEIGCEQVLEAISEEHEYQMDSKEVALAMLALYVRCAADLRRQIKGATKAKHGTCTHGGRKDVAATGAAAPNIPPLFPGNTTVKAEAWLEQSLTWPSVEEMRRDVPLCWGKEDDVRDVLGRCFVRDHMESNTTQLRAVFDGAVLPLLQEELGQEPEANMEQGASSISSRRRELRVSDFILPIIKEQGMASQRDELWESVRYAYAIVYSRAHESVDEVPELIPLVDLLNGLSDVCKGSAINVDFVSGKWPFVRGKIYENHCNLDCSALYAERDVKAGTSLIISYGCLTPSSFFVKYGTVPSDHLRHANMTDSVNIWFPPHLIPDEITSIGKLRCIALEKGGYPLEAFRQGTIRLLFLPGDDDSSGNNPLAWYVSEEELGVLETLQRIIVLSCLADEAALQRYIVAGIIRCNLDSEMLFRIMVGVLDYNLKLLSSTATKMRKDGDSEVQPISASKSDVEHHSEDPNLSPAFRASYLARTCQRETLAKWRHAFCRRYMQPSHADTGGVVGTGIELPDELDCSACRVCGRMYPNFCCSRCKWRGKEAASYCCRAHQSSDWRLHKRECKKEPK